MLKFLIFLQVSQPSSSHDQMVMDESETFFDGRRIMDVFSDEIVDVVVESVSEGAGENFGTNNDVVPSSGSVPAAIESTSLPPTSIPVRAGPSSSRNSAQVLSQIPASRPAKKRKISDTDSIASAIERLVESYQDPIAVKCKMLGYQPEVFQKQGSKWIFEFNRSPDRRHPEQKTQDKLNKPYY